MAKREDQMLAQLTEAGPGGHALALRILGNREDAADAVQDAAQAVLDKRSFDPARGEFRTWFLTLVRNRCLDVLRQRARRGETSLENAEPISDVGDPARGAEQDERVEILRIELAKLDTGQREILVLRDYLGTSYSDIATVLSIPVGTVMSRLHRARLALAERMKRYERW